MAKSQKAPAGEAAKAAASEASTAASKPGKCLFQQYNQCCSRDWVADPPIMLSGVMLMPDWSANRVVVPDCV